MARLASESSEDGQESVSPNPQLSASDASLSEVKEVREESPVGMVAMATSDGQKVEVTVDEVTDDLVIPSEDVSVRGSVSDETTGACVKPKSNAFYFYQCKYYL